MIVFLFQSLPVVLLKHEVKHSDSITLVIMPSNRVSSADFCSFCMRLRQTRSLKLLQVTHKLETHEAKELASALKQNSSLQMVCIKEATDEGIKILETALMLHPTLLYLELPGGKKLIPLD